MSDDAANYEISERGFVHWTPVPTTYGHEVKVYESSAAEQACMWLAISPKLHGQDCGEQCAHLTYEQALEVHGRIGAWLERHRAEFARRRADAYASALAAELGVPWRPESPSEGPSSSGGER